MSELWGDKLDPESEPIINWSNFWKSNLPVKILDFSLMFIWTLQLCIMSKYLGRVNFIVPEKSFYSFLGALSCTILLWISTLVRILWRSP